MLSAFFRFLVFCRPCTVPPFAIDQFRLSIRLSVRDKSEHCKNGEKKTYGEFINTELLGDPSPTP